MFSWSQNSYLEEVLTSLQQVARVYIHIATTSTLLPHGSAQAVVRNIQNLQKIVTKQSLTIKNKVSLYILMIFDIIHR